MPHLPHTARYFVAFATLLAAPGFAELDKKQAGLLKRTSGYITNVQNSLEHESAGALPNERVVGELRKKLDKYEKDIQSLPADDSAVQAEIAHLAQVRQALDGRAGTLKAAQDARASEDAAIAALYTAPEFEADLEAMTQFAESFESAQLLAPDSYVFGRWPTNSNVVQLQGWTTAWAQTQKRFAELKEKYAASIASRRMISGDTDIARAKMKGVLDDASDRIGAFSAAMKTLTDSAPGEVESLAKTLNTEVDKAVAAKDFGTLVNPDGKVQELRWRIENLATIWGPLAPSDAERAKLSARAKAIDAAVEARLDKLSEAIITSNKAPANAYGGGDAKEVEALVRSTWAKKFPADAIVAIRFTAGAFERRTAWEWDNGMNAWVKHDSSHLPGWVIVRDGSARAIMWPVAVYRRHLKGNALEVGVPERSSHVSPNHRLLLSNL